MNRVIARRGVACVALLVTVVAACSDDGAPSGSTAGTARAAVESSSPTHLTVSTSATVETLPQRAVTTASRSAVETTALVPASPTSSPAASRHLCTQPDRNGFVGPGTYARRCCAGGHGLHGSRGRHRVRPVARDGRVDRVVSVSIDRSVFRRDLPTRHPGLIRSRCVQIPGDRRVVRGRERGASDLGCPTRPRTASSTRRRPFHRVWSI